MNREIQLIRAVALQADALDAEAERFGQRAAQAILGDAGNRQIKVLESVANSALKVSDVLDYVKRQTAKCEPGKTWRNNSFGVDLLSFLSVEVRGRRDTIIKQLEASEVEGQRIHLMLIREFVRQMAAHSLFVAMRPEGRR